MPPIRLNKYLAGALGISRREADDMIGSGKVKIGKTTAQLGARVDGDAEVFADGKLVRPLESFTTIIFHKPAGYVSSRRAQGSAPTLYELLPEQYHSLKTVGRLDKDSSGLLLLTNDGDLAFRMTHPSYQKVKLYKVSLDHPLAPLHQQMIADYGISLPDGTSKLGLTPLDDTRKHWEVTMSEGRNRQIRRTFGAVGYTVEKLHRTQFGPYSLGDLPAGDTKPA